ncbi:MAG: hypothetical protein A2527_14155 [Candidatus Lambdaproteobacteria bacterium RIFOXYD2_FULL_50_16]|uniref:Uncharacterized protein n=1 Tax=Candidatus Lambdaproteobacteria bacterium RIFOXYD2_FULL_50_16 TaxID=1817772 RepID=A0A1F6G4M0_9PROT|nr:MAG: hypothetical protein A2527_14155 [Candidatus Lambdaproteobacteria bacterium RIFOXYD2_FULL_50_16]
MDFEQSFSFLLQWEGAVSDHPDDRGGLTVYGLSERTHPEACAAAFVAYKAGDEAGAKAIAQEVYRAEYWQKCRCPELDPRLAAAVFDAAVNLGTRGAGICLQKTINRLGGGVAPDGAIGPLTVAAAKTLLDALAWRQFNLERLAYYAEIAQKRPGQRAFLLGWINRTLALGDLIGQGET